MASASCRWVRIRRCGCGICSRRRSSARRAAPPAPSPGWRCFPAAVAPRAGWVRDFVIKGDGWIKDGDYNSTFSKTVGPLPHHSERDYDKAPGRLEDEWAFRHHPEDWVDYHTRYIDPSVVGNALMSGR